MTDFAASTALPVRLTSARARSMAECKWGRRGTNVCKTNTKHAYYFSCSGHGGYIVDGAALTSEQRAQIDQHVQPDLISAVVRGEVVDFMANPYSNRKQTYRSRSGQAIVKHPIYFFEEDCDWAVLEKFTPIRLIGQYTDEANHEQFMQDTFDRWCNKPTEVEAARTLVSNGAPAGP